MPRHFDKLESCSTGRGLKYEHSMCSLVFLRAMKLKYAFSLASNMKNCGAFDDVVLQFSKESKKKRCIFIQMKSKATKIVGFSSLMSMSKTDFSLMKYFLSYLEIKKSFNEQNKTPFDGEFDDSLFVLYTNSDVSGELKMLHDDTREDDMIHNAREILLTNQQNGESLLQFKLEGKICDALVKGLMGKHKETEENGKKGDNTDVLQSDERNSDNIKEKEVEIRKQVVEFLRKVVIMYKQAEEERFDEVVKEELQGYLKLPNEEIGLTYAKFQQLFEDWWQKESYFLDSWNKSNPITEAVECVKSEVASQFLKLRRIDVENLNIAFEYSALNKTREVVEKNQAILMYSCVQTTQPTVAKVNQLLSNHAILNLKDLVQKLDYFVIAWRRGLFDFLVVDLCEVQNKLDDSLARIAQCVREDKKRKVIFTSVYGKYMSQVRAIRNVFRDMLKVSEVSLRYAELSAETRRAAVDKEVLFQGEPVALSELVNHTELSILEDLNEEEVSMLLSSRMPVVGCGLDDSLKYYITRKLEITRVLSDKVLEENAAVFALDAATILRHGLSACSVDHWMPDSACKFVSIQDSSEFEKLSEVAANVHWLVSDGDKLFWKRSCGDLKVVLRHLIPHDVSELQPVTVLDGEDRLMLLTAEPGMGKSSLLSNLAKNTKKKHPDMWVLRININSFTKILEDIKAHGFREEKATEMLQMAAGIKNPREKSLETGLFKKAFIYEGKMAVLVDGLDEVSPNYTEQALRIVRFLCETQIAKIWVTSRIFMKAQLEQEFGIPSYSLVPFDKQEQELFLVRYWKSLCPEKDEEVLKRLASSIRRQAAEMFKGSETDFMAIPIQTLLLAEISGSLAQPTIDNINLCTLFELYVKMKWNIYLREKMNADTTNVVISQDTAALYRKFMENHKTTAVVTFLKPDMLEEIKSPSLVNQASAFVQNVRTGVEKTGIIQCMNDAGQAVFMHRTFCEYFVSLWVFDNIKCSQQRVDFEVVPRIENVQPVLRRIFDDQFQVVKTILEIMLAKDFPVHTAILNGNEAQFRAALSRDSALEEEDFGGRTPLHVAASSGQKMFAGELLDRGADECKCDTLLQMSAVSYAVQAQHWSTLSEILEKRPGSRERELGLETLARIPVMMSLIRSAQQNSHGDLLRYLSQDKGWVLLHAGATSGQIEFVELVLKIGTLVDVTNPEGRTALHIASENEDLQLAHLLISKGCSVTAADCSGVTALHVAVERQSASMLQLLLNRKADVNARNRSGSTCVHIACRSGNLEIAMFLLSSGADISLLENGRSPLHIACEHGHAELCRVLAEHLGDVNVHDDHGSSPLHIASERGHVNVVEVLLRAKADVNVTDSSGQAPLHVASRAGHINVVQALVDIGATLDLKDKNGSTALQLATSHGHLQVREWLKSHGASEDLPVVEQEGEKEEDLQYKITRETARVVNQVHDEGQRFMKRLKKLF